MNRAETQLAGPLLLVAICLLALTGCQPGQTAPGPQDPDAPKEFSETASGLKYRILRKSDGKHPTAASRVTVHYKGWLDSNRVFDSSYPTGTPVSFGLNEVIAGWTEGVQLIGEGGMIELEIPPELGYGREGTPGIPANSRLHFYIELKKVE